LYLSYHRNSTLTRHIPHQIWPRPRCTNTTRVDHQPPLLLSPVRHDDFGDVVNRLRVDTPHSCIVSFPKNTPRRRKEQERKPYDPLPPPEPTSRKPNPISFHTPAINQCRKSTHQYTRHRRMNNPRNANHDIQPFPPRSHHSRTAAPLRLTGPADLAGVAADVGWAFQINVFAPLAMNMRAMPAPKPEPPPVMMAVLWARRGPRCFAAAAVVIVVAKADDVLGSLD